MDYINPNELDRNLVESPELLGRECVSCYRILPWSCFRKSTTHREGHVEQCVYCENSPRLSTDEQVSRLKEQNYNSEAVKKQRFDHQEEYQNDAARRGRRMTHSDFLLKLLPLVPSLFITEGNIVGDLALFRVFSKPQPHLDGKDFEYVCYCPTGVLNEFSTYEWDTEKDVPIREKERGWRAICLRLIQNKMVSESDINRVFGEPTGAGASVYLRKLYQFRNQKDKI